jgi:hypothetical protein
VEAELARLRAAHPEQLQKDLEAQRVTISSLERQMTAQQVGQGSGFLPVLFRSFCLLSARPFEP